MSAVALSISLWLVLSNFTMVTGGSAAISTVLALVPPVGFIIGVIVNRKDDGRTVDINLEKVLEAQD